MEKIHAPQPGVLVFRLFAQAKKLHLVFRFERQRPLIFFTAQPPENPKNPTAEVMRLRKYLLGRRIDSGRLDWPRRRLAFPLPARGAASDDGLGWLLLDLRQGPALLRHLPEDFAEPPLWPDQAALRQLHDSARTDFAAWLQYPVLTPLLRHTLSRLDFKDGLALVVDLETDNDCLHAYAAKGEPQLVSAWPLPEEQIAEDGLTPLETAACNAPHDLAPALSLASRVNEAVFFKEFGQKKQKTAEKPDQRQRKKLSRLLNALSAEEKRLGEMTALKKTGRLLQENLWRIADKEAKLAEISLTGPDGTEETVLLNPRLTIMENMRHMFHQAGRGERGLAMLEPRKAEIRKGIDALERRLEAGVEPAGIPAPEPQPGKKKKGRDPLKDVARFISSDGYTMLRGKSAKGNHALLRLGRPYDIWIHAESGPSAHLIIRRAHGTDEVPESTLKEAASLVALKSGMADRDMVPVMCAYLRHVQPIKGATPGTVQVARVEKRLLAPPAPELETLLRLPDK